MDSKSNISNTANRLAKQGYEIEWIELYLFRHFGSNNMDYITDAINRVSQIDFRKRIVDRDKICLISGFDASECEAAHIIPYSECKSYDSSNGILLNRCLHKLFDEFMFSINPATFKIEIRKSNKLLSINKYKNKIIKVPVGCIKNLKKHYEKFVELNV